MQVMQYIKDFIRNLDEREFLRYLAVVLGSLVLVLGFLIFFNSSKVNSLQLRLKRINKQREETREILQKHAIVKQQQAEVDAILAKDPTFKIKEYFTGIVAELNLIQNNTKQAEVSEPQDLDNGYSEVKLNAGFTDLNMKQLCELLYKIEQNERIYTKEIVITKSLKTPTIDVTLVVATLQPKAATA